jgi:hypothetical protein
MSRTFRFLSSQKRGGLFIETHHYYTVGNDTSVGNGTSTYTHKCIQYSYIAIFARYTAYSICHTLQRKSHLCIPSLGIARPQSQFPHSCVCEHLYIPRIGPGIWLQQNRQTDPVNI